VVAAGGSPLSAAVGGLRTTPWRSTPWRYRPPPWRVEALAVGAGPALMRAPLATATASRASRPIARPGRSWRSDGMATGAERSRSPATVLTLAGVDFSILGPARYRPIGGVGSFPLAPVAFLGRIEHRGLAAFDDVLRAAHRTGWIGLHHVPGHKPIEEVAKRREALLDARRGKLARLRFDPSGDVQGRDVMRRRGVAAGGNAKVLSRGSRVRCGRRRRGGPCSTASTPRRRRACATGR
jgi:hypothetical protein